MDLSQAVISGHAASQMAKRSIDEAEVRAVLSRPESIEPARPGRVVAQGMAGVQLLRVIVDVDRRPAEVVTAYRTNKIAKYRRTP
jgi:hypothetical protein